MTQDVSSLSFENAMTELDSIVRKLEEGQNNLENSIQSYERGIALKKHCETKLREAQMKIEKITLSGDKAVGTEAFETEETS